MQQPQQPAVQPQQQQQATVITQQQSPQQQQPASQPQPVVVQQPAATQPASAAPALVQQTPQGNMSYLWTSFDNFSRHISLTLITRVSLQALVWSVKQWYPWQQRWWRKLFLSRLESAQSLRQRFRSLGQVNVFPRMCHSVPRGREGLL